MADFKKMSIEELYKTIADKRESLRTFRFGGAGSRSRNVREGRMTRREIARVMTEITARNTPKNAKVDNEAKNA